ncbi:tubulin polyglutamylase TTLL4 [Platysternon megacephalum]|uniref:Tubulin polyglutamylase TTLL4 n=1 Tax=Platysternon megacephalum TaxID=55544 RepID=A0A4D9EA93_9SAUR|nr:tubulin polyglutamylase TTLL4 [Platysternon megacephalum]
MGLELQSQHLLLRVSATQLYPSRRRKRGWLRGRWRRMVSGQQRTEGLQTAVPSYGARRGFSLSLGPSALVSHSSWFHLPQPQQLFCSLLKRSAQRIRRNTLG